MSLQLDSYDRLPSRLAETGIEDIRAVFPYPSLIHVEGESGPPLFVSTLLHGNETTSYRVLQHLAREYADTRPPRSLMIFVGNVRAAEAGVRHLDDEPDFNRIWAEGQSPWHELTHRVMEAARAANIVASIDIHNNTGSNPLYGCVNALRPADLQLATLFAPVGVYYLNPPTTQSIAFSHLCPAVTVECGKSGDEEGIRAAISLVEKAMRLSTFAMEPPSAGSFTLYHTIGRVTINEEASYSFGEADAALRLRGDLEEMNFVHMPAGSVWARNAAEAFPLKVANEHGEDLTAQFFHLDGPDIRLTRQVVPSMVTRDRDVIRQDCLCYLMEPVL